MRMNSINSVKFVKWIFLNKCVFEEGNVSSVWDPHTLQFTGNPDPGPEGKNLKQTTFIYRFPKIFHKCYGNLWPVKDSKKMFYI